MTIRAQGVASTFEPRFSADVRDALVLTVETPAHASARVYGAAISSLASARAPAEHLRRKSRRCTAMPSAQAAPFPHFKSVSEAMRDTLKRPDKAFAWVFPSLLLKAVEHECGTVASSWAAYQRERYGYG